MNQHRTQLTFDCHVRFENIDPEDLCAKLSQFLPLRLAESLFGPQKQFEFLYVSFQPNDLKLRCRKLWTRTVGLID